MVCFKSFPGLFSVVALAFACNVATHADERGLVAEVSSCPGPRTEQKARPKIVGGWSAEHDDWPGLVSVRFRGSESEQDGYLCGGSIISPEWVLTAAHCVESPAINRDEDTGRYVTRFELWRDLKKLGFSGKAFMQVVADADNLASVEDEQTRVVEEIIVHPEYKRYPTPVNDIALLKLSQPWVGEYTRLAMSPSADPPTPPGAVAMVGGFGVLQYLQQLELFQSNDGRAVAAGSPVLREVDVPTVSIADCQGRYDTAAISRSQICAGFDDEQKDSCQGDSGGPLVAFDNNRCPYQIGIVSWGAECAEPKNYGVYTRVSAYTSWIRRHVPGELLTIAAQDVPDWRADARRVELAQQNLRELSRLLEPAESLAGVTLVRQTDSKAVANNRLKLNERYEITVESEIDGRLVLVDIDAAGKVVQIFPNKFTSDELPTFIRKNVPLKLPGPGYGFDWFRAGEPVGVGQLVVLVVPEDFPLSTWVASENRLAKGLVPEQSEAGYLMNLSTQISKALENRGIGVDREPEHADLVDWAIDIVEYEIVR